MQIEQIYRCMDDLFFERARRAIIPLKDDESYEIELIGDKCDVYFHERGQRFWTATVGTPVVAAHLIDLLINGQTRWQD